MTENFSGRWTDGSPRGARTPREQQVPSPAPHDSHRGCGADPASSVAVVVDCRDCGFVRVRPAAVTLRYCVDNREWTYRFICQTCGGRNVATTEATLARAALDAGAPLETWQLPARSATPDSWPRFSELDVRALLHELDQPGWERRLEALTDTDE